MTHQGPPMSTFVSVPRALLYGKRDRLWGIFPPAELSGRELERMSRLGAAAAARLDELGPPYHPLLTGLGAVHVRRRYIVPELMGWYLYRAAARVITGLGRRSSVLRGLAVRLFLVFMILVISVGIPLAMVVVLLLSPLLRTRIDRYARRLAAPSEPEETPAGPQRPKATTTAPALTGPPEAAGG
jgi:hypothetical protein